MTKQILNESANISVEFNGSTAYFHLPNSNLYNIYLNPNQTLRPNIYSSGNPSLNFNASNWPLKFDKIVNMTNFFPLNDNKVTYIGNGILFAQNQFMRCQTLSGCAYAYGDIYYNTVYPSEYESTGPSILPRNSTTWANSNYAYATATRDFEPTTLFGMFFNTMASTLNSAMTGARYGRVNLHVHSNSLMNNYLYNYAVSYLRCNDTNNVITYSKISWATMTNGYYNSLYNIYVYYNNPHQEVFNSRTNIAGAFMAEEGRGRGRYVPTTSLQPICSDNVTDMSNAYSGWRLCTQHPACGSNVVNMSHAYYLCQNLTGSPVVGDKVINMSFAYCYGENLTGQPVSGSNVSDMSSAYLGCHSLTGYPVCGPNVINMRLAYADCFRITGAPVAGNNVKDMVSAYSNCRNLTGSPVCPPNVINMTWAYSNCNKLTGAFAPKIHNKLSDMAGAYNNCNGLTNLNMLLYNGRNLSYAFSNCGQLNSGANLFLYYFDKYFIYNGINSYIPGINLYYALYQTSGQVNIHVVRNREFDILLYNYANSVKIRGSNIVWTAMTNGYYNTASNIYVYNNHNISDNLSPYYGYNVMNEIDASNKYNNFVCLFGSPVCGDIIENMAYMYNNCKNISGSPEVGNNVINMAYAYSNCINISGNPKCGNNVTNMALAYYNCRNLTGSPVIGPNVTNMYAAYSGCSNLTGNPVFGEKVSNVAQAYAGCSNLTGSPIFQNTFTDIFGLYNGCSKLTGNFIIPEGFTDMRYLYSGCANLTGNIQNIFNNSHNCLIRILYLFNGCTNLTGSPWCGPNINSLEGTYQNCYNLTGSPVCGANVMSMSSAYSSCYNLTGSPVCGANVNSLYNTYQNCYNLTGSPVCGANVTSMVNAYQNCYNLTGSPVCGANVMSMSSAYQNCYNLTGSPVCGANVTNMSNAYRGCRNITGNPVLSASVININNAYYGCSKLTGTVYWNYSGANLNNVIRIMNNTEKAFGGRNEFSPRINLYISNSMVFSNLYNIRNARSLLGVSTTWTNYSTTFFYNTKYNLYVYTGSSYPTGSYTVRITGTGTNCLLDGNASYSGSSTTTTSSKSITLTTSNASWMVPLLADVNNYITVKGSEFTYSRTNNTYATISLKNMAPTVTVNAKAVIAAYSVSLTGNNLLINGESNYSVSVPVGDTATLSLTASGDYKLPSTINLQNLNVTYNRISDTSGTLVINPSGANQSISRTITADIKRADLTYSVTNCTSASSNPSQCTDTNYDSLQLQFTFDGTNYTCPAEGSGYTSVTGADAVWYKQSDTSGYMMLTKLYTNDITVSVMGESTSVNVVTVNATQDYGWYGLTIYDCVNGVDPRNYIGHVDSGSTSVELSTPFLYLSADSVHCQEVTGGVSQYEGSASIYSVTGDGSVTVSYTTQCFVKGTEITMADGSRKAVEDIEYGDELKVWNLDIGDFDTAPVIWLTKRGLKNDHYYKLTFSDGTILCTTGTNSNHKVYNVDERFFKGVDKTQIGDRIFSENGIVTVVDKQYIEEEVEYYNLITSQQFNCFANGILTADRYGNMYEIDEDMKFIKEDRPVRPLEEFTNAGIQEYWYNHFRLYESADSLDSILFYVAKCESHMRKLPEDFDPTWKK